jgi:acyl dehydratase
MALATAVAARGAPMGVLASTAMERPCTRAMRASRVPWTLVNYGKRNLNEGRSAMAEDPQTHAPARHPRGGLYFEDFVIGQVHRHRLTRTVTQMDNMLFSNMTLNPQPLHIDRHFCERETEWGQPLMNSLFTLGLMIGISVNDLTVGTTVANLGMTEVKFPHPLFEGDTVHCSTTVVAKRESKSRPGMGIVELDHRAYNQDDKLVAECRRQALMRMRPR